MTSFPLFMIPKTCSEMRGINCKTTFKYSKSKSKLEITGCEFGNNSSFTFSEDSLYRQ